MLQREGFHQFRVRDHGDIARIEVGQDDIPALLDATKRSTIGARFKELGFKFVTVDLEGYRPGGVSLG